jgi:membrane-associated PAP2 superfamily phosphatase
MFLIVIMVLEYLNIDYIFSSFFYDSQHHQWPLRNFWLTKKVLHDWAHRADIALEVTIFCVLILSLFTTSLKKYKKPLAFLLLASLSGPVFVLMLKNSTHIYCPWDLTIFGADKPYIHLFDRVDDSLQVGNCVPGGHSSGGFAVLSLYYFFMLIKPEYKLHGLGIGLISGSVFGLAQEMRGAHFLSHDITSLAICWLLSSVFFLVFFYKDLIVIYSEELRIQKRPKELEIAPQTNM